MEYLLFDLIQNLYGEYPEFSPHMVIKLAKKGSTREGFGGCSEMGKTDFVGGRGLFRPVDEDTELAFLGEKVVKGGITFLRVVEDEMYQEEMNRLLEEYK